MQHEGDVLEDNPRDRPIVEKAEHFADQTRPLAANSGRQSSLAQVLTGKARRQELHVTREILQVPDVALARYALEVGTQHRSGGVPDLAKELGLVASRRQPELETSYTREKPRDPHLPTLPDTHPVQAWSRITLE